MDTVELSREVEIRRMHHFLARLDYLRPHMASGEQAMLDALTKGASPEFLKKWDEAIDREEV